MTIILDGDIAYPLREYQDNRPVDLDDVRISKCTRGHLQSWLDEYSKYIPMKLEELSIHWKEVDRLDKQGEGLLRKIASEYRSQEIEKYYYFSLCRDKLQFVIFQDGKEKEFS